MSDDGAIWQLLRADKLMQAVELLEASPTSSSGCASFCYSATAAGRGGSLPCYSPTCRAYSAAREAAVARVAAVRWIRSQTKTLDGWELHRDARGIKTYSKWEGDDGLVSMRAEGHIEAPLMAILSVFFEIDLWTTWMPSYKLVGLRSAAMLAQASATELLVHQICNVPWPLEPRDLMLRVVGVDCMDKVEVTTGRPHDPGAASEAAAADAEAGVNPATNHAAQATAHSPAAAAATAAAAQAPHDPSKRDSSGPKLPADPDNAARQIVILIESTGSFAGEDVPAAAKGSTRMEVLHGGLVLTPKCVNGAGGTGTHLELCLKIDPKLQFMPSFLVNIVFKYIVFMFFELLQKQAQGVPGTEYEKRIERGNLFYDFIKRRMDEVGFPEEQ